MIGFWPRTKHARKTHKRVRGMVTENKGKGYIILVNCNSLLYSM